MTWLCDEAGFSAAESAAVSPLRSSRSNARRALVLLRPRLHNPGASHARKTTRVRAEVCRPAELPKSHVRVRVRPSLRRGQGRPGGVLGGRGEAPGMVRAVEEKRARGGSCVPKLVGFQRRGGAVVVVLVVVVVVVVVWERLQGGSNCYQSL